MTTAYTERLDRALALAAESFRGTFRKSTKVPYLTHLLAVCASVGEHGGDEDQMIAAVLHDYLEDVDGARVEDLSGPFGERVARLVLALSDSVSSPKPPWKERKEKYLQHLRAEPAEVKLISAADKLHNCRSILRDHYAQGDAVFSRFTASKDQTLWYYRSVTAALAEGWDHPILKELKEAVHDLHKVAGNPTF